MFNFLERSTLASIEDMLMNIVLISIGVMLYLFMITTKNSNFKRNLWIYYISCSIAVVSEIILIILIFKEGI